MQLNVSKWGNSLAVRLPAHVAQEARLKEGVAVEVTATDGKIVLTAVRKKFKLAELLQGVPERTQEDAATSAEFDWGKPKGEEAW
ncbi:AbrB/MazE/SpoVT family DNA-binding domain-containing protein [Paracoccus aerius]|uniref:AbrB/MazE/SpoVT family DNA-binding domain-containing protein n=1 Tax=Paracoccus aerius TaxID=1915382 RepID=A0ABS1SAS2_9RHOB|nr:AbrB/MazE/SpoVT family DNA-binding domain-containing protein [Paracoccus aerius]MBL3675829.1 AbrB/MazE/SpoVT family DNA-binding domain-containing protein [Paracoccus aerius]GHG37762.1 cell division protein [Paracoccus aerius]